MLVAILSLFSVEGKASQRVALVIGNSAYFTPSAENIFAPLTNPVYDAQDMADILQQYGFEVNLLTNATYSKMTDAIDRFSAQLERDGVGLFFYSGHGVQVQNSNYLIPVGRNFADGSDIQDYAVKANWVLSKLEASATRVNIMILDACREEFQLEQRKGLPQNGFAVMGATGAIIGYAASPGEVAYGNTDTRNSLYTQHLLNALKKSNLPIELVFKETAMSVVQATEGKQNPWIGSNLIGNFCFGECQDTQATQQTSALLPVCQQHFDANRLISGRGGNALDCYEQVLQLDPANNEALAGIQRIEGRYVSLIAEALAQDQRDNAARLIERLRMLNPDSPELPKFEAQMTPTPSPTPSPVPAASTPTPVVVSQGPVAGTIFNDPVSGLDFVWIPAGTFQMGCRAPESCEDDEMPTHFVTLDGFWMAQTETTQGQWARALGPHPTAGKGDLFPLEQLSWQEIQDFINRLNQQTGQNCYRLPTEAEWEYASRAGSQSAYAFGADAGLLATYAWYQQNSQQALHPVGQRQANRWGLFDMSGNAWEWCQDWYGAYSETPQTNPFGTPSGDYKVLRGGSWNNPPESLRSAFRIWCAPENTCGGFRLVRIAPPQP